VVFIFGFTIGASHLHRRSLSKPSGTQLGLSLNSVVHTNFWFLELGCKDRVTKVLQPTALATGDE
jgi:hypothetical protein